MSNINLLISKDGTGHLYADNTIYLISEKPVFSFSYSDLAYSVSGLFINGYLDTKNSGEVSLFCTTYKSNYKDKKVDSLVYGIGENNEFLGFGNKADFSVWTLLKPDHPSCVFDYDSDSWNRVYGVDVFGNYVETVDFSDPEITVIFFERKHSYQIWNFDKNVWSDPAPLTKRRLCLTFLGDHLDSVFSNLLLRFELPKNSFLFGTQENLLPSDSFPEFKKQYLTVLDNYSFLKSFIDTDSIEEFKDRVLSVDFLVSVNKENKELSFDKVFDEKKVKKITDSEVSKNEDIASKNNDFENAKKEATKLVLSILEEKGVLPNTKKKKASKTKKNN